MTDKDKIEMLEKVVHLTKATPEQIQLMFHIYKTLLNNRSHLCASCPTVVRKTHNSLKILYNNLTENNRR